MVLVEHLVPSFSFYLLQLVSFITGESKLFIINQFIALSNLFIENKKTEFALKLTAEYYRINRKNVKSSDILTGD